MSSNLKFWYVVCMDGYKTIFNQRCLDIGEANRLLIAKKEEYKDNRNIMVSKENY